MVEPSVEPAISLPLEQERQFAPGTEIPYTPSFPSHLRAQSAVIRGLLDSLADASQKQAYSQLSAILDEFVGRLEQRFLEQNVRLFVYLSKCLKGADQQALVKDMKRDMGMLNRKARQFGCHYLERPVNSRTVADFREDLAMVDVVLKDQLQRESDSLYILYFPPDRY